MAFGSNPKSNSNSSDNKDAGKAVAFINLSLPTQGGKERKVGAIALRGDKPQEAELAAWFLSGTDEERAAKLTKFLSKLVVTVQSSEIDANSFFNMD